MDYVLHGAQGAGGAVLAGPFAIPLLHDACERCSRPGVEANLKVPDGGGTAPRGENGDKVVGLHVLVHEFEKRLSNPDYALEVEAQIIDGEGDGSPDIRRADSGWWWWKNRIQR